MPSLSQTISTEEERVHTYINEYGDTMVTMHYEDARILLRDVLYYEFTDSLLSEFRERDELNTKTITFQKEAIEKLTQKTINLDSIVSNLEQVIENKDGMLELKEDVINQQKKEIRKQKFLKTLGFIGTVVVPIIVLIALV